MCGHCFAICPQNAVAISGFDDEPEAVAIGRRVDSDTLLYQLKARRSMRHFTEEDVSIDDIMQIIEAGRYTPTGSNKQDVSYVVLKDEIAEYERIALAFLRKAKKVLDVFSSRFRGIEIDDDFLFKKAPVAIVIKSSSITDGALAASSMELMAQSMGLGVLYSGFFTKAAQSSGALKKKLGVASGEKVALTLVIGHPAMEYQRTAPKEKPAITFV